MASSGYAASDAALSSLNKELRPKLSSSALITASTDPDWEEYARWSAYNSPIPGAVVSPASEQDVAVIVCSIPRLSTFVCRVNQEDNPLTI